MAVTSDVPPRLASCTACSNSSSPLASSLSSPPLIASCTACSNSSSPLASSLSSPLRSRSLARRVWTSGWVSLDLYDDEYDATGAPPVCITHPHHPSAPPVCTTRLPLTCLGFRLPALLPCACAPTMCLCLCTCAPHEICAPTTQPMITHGSSPHRDATVCDRLSDDLGRACDAHRPRHSAGESSAPHPARSRPANANLTQPLPPPLAPRPCMHRPVRTRPSVGSHPSMPPRMWCMRQLLASTSNLPP